MLENVIDARNAAVNILAVEYLIKRGDNKEYGRLVDIVTKLTDDDLGKLYLELALNMHIKNLGEMITHGDYEQQRDNLLVFLNRFTSSSVIY